jgi:glyoxylase-like metal-dependent hydrolase (beta-lactamase superfamily II)
MKPSRGGLRGSQVGDLGVVASGKAGSKEACAKPLPALRRVEEDSVTSTIYPLDTGKTPQVTAFFDPASNTISYVVRDPASNACAAIDPVLDFDYASGRIGFKSAGRIVDFICENGLKLEWLIETHAHADHLSAAPYIQEKLGGKIGIGERIREIQETFGKLFNEGTEFQRDGSQFDRLFEDGDTYTIGGLTAFAMHTPGHTPACMTHVIGNAAFVGDTLFMPDGGTARADFPGGDARQLYRSIEKVLSLPPEMRLFMCHDYGPGQREIRWETTVAEERASNIHVRDGIGEDEFVAMRTARDKTLGMPKLIIPSIQVNMRAGHLPEPEAGGKSFLKVPLNGL